MYVIRWVSGNHVYYYKAQSRTRLIAKAKRFKDRATAALIATDIIEALPAHVAVTVNIIEVN